MLKNLRFVSVLLFLIFLINFISADITLEKSRINLNEPLSITINLNSYSSFVYFYSEAGSLSFIANLGCPESSCSGRQTFLVPLSSDKFPAGTYSFLIYSSDDNQQHSTKFEVGTATATTETPQPSSTSCYDGTSVGECSPSRGKPYYCSSTSGSPELVTNCNVCGCPTIYPYCQADGSCSGSAPATSSSIPSTHTSVSVNTPSLDTDGDGIPDIHDPDANGDGVMDFRYRSINANDDLDHDGIININDNDIDGDGILNGFDVAFAFSGRLNIPQGTTQETSSTAGVPFDGYIVELNEKPLVTQRQDLEKRAERNNNNFLVRSIARILPRSIAPVVSGNIEGKTDDAKRNLENKRENFKEQAKNALNKNEVVATGSAIAGNTGDNLVVLGEFEDVFNGVALNITAEEAKKIEKINGVKKVYPNYKVNIALSDSVPLINADDVWQLDADGNNCAESGHQCLTGAGIKIGIIDTGVDYTHGDLGGSSLPPLPDFLKKISDTNLPTGYNLEVSGNKVYFSNNFDIYLYDYQTDSTQKILLNEDYSYNRFFIYDNIMFAVVNKKDTGESGMVEIDLNTNSERVLIPFTERDMELYAHRTGKYLFLDLADNINVDRPIFKEYIYDFSSKNLYYIRDIMSGWGVVNNDKIYTVDGNDASHILVDDFKNGQQLEDFNTGGVGTALLDSFGDEILVYRIWTGVYEIINTKTGNIFQIPSENQQQITSGTTSQSLIWISMPWLAALNDKIIVLEDMNAYGDHLNKFYIYDRLENKIVSFSNLLFKINEVHLDGNRICFNSIQLKLYCFDYDSDNNYIIPEFTGFNSKVVGGYDFINNDNDPMDDMGHGTHVASIAAGNGVLKGVAPDAEIYAYKVLDSGGSGSWDTVVSGIERAVDPNNDGDFSDHLDIISLSLGGWGNPDDAPSQAIDNAVSAGVVAVVAAGNSGPDKETIGSPGTARNAITVGAIDKESKLAYFSSRGPVTWEDSEGKTNTIIKPDVVAPGVNICAAEYDSAWSDRKCLDDNHIAISGTSMATPHVAGAAALLLQKHPDWTPEEIKMALRNTAVDLGLGLPVIEQGFGKIDVLNAVNFQGVPSVAKIEVVGKITGAINIRGTASGREFNRYTLYYGSGENPESWVELISSTTPVENGILYSNFDTTLLDEGTNYLKLVVWNNAGEKSEDRNVLEVNNVEITSLLDNDIYRLGDNIKIEGSISDASSYYFEWGEGENPSQWNDNGFSNANTGNLIGEFDSNVLPSSGFYSIRLIATIRGREKIESVKNIYFDSTLREGWPQRINFESLIEPQSLLNTALLGNSEFYTIIPKVSSSSTAGQNRVLTKQEFLSSMGNESFAQTQGDHYWAGFLEPVVDDLDKDGIKEIIVYSGGFPPKLRVYSPDGSIKLIKDVGTEESPGGNLPLPLVGDLNNDGFDEIIAFNPNSPDGIHSEIYAFNHDGSLLWSTPISFDYHPTLLMADLNLDGNKEIVIKGSDAFNEIFMTIVNNQGSIISKWSLPHPSWGATIVSSPAVGNFDNDIELEIVSVSPDESAGYNWDTKEYTNTGIIYVYNLDGSVVSGWPVHTNGTIFSSPVVGDINNDGKDEIVIGVMTGANAPVPDFPNGGVYAFDRNGNVLPGWPYEQGYCFWSTPALGDINNDGNLEISVSALGFETSLLHHDGTIVEGWPQYTAWNDYYSSIMADINNDGSLDVLTTAGGIYECKWGNCGGVYAWNKDGTLINGFPKATENDAQAPAVVDDIDNNGKAELIASSDWDSDENGIEKMRGSIYVWNLIAPYNSGMINWPMFMHDPQHTGLYAFPNHPTCTDSDGGKNYYVKSTMREFADSLNSANTDNCIDTNTLLEYFCPVLGVDTSVQYTCPNGCQDGACIINSTITLVNGIPATIQGLNLLLLSSYSNYAGSTTPATILGAEIIVGSEYTLSDGQSTQIRDYLFEGKNPTLKLISSGINYSQMQIMDLDGKYLPAFEINKKNNNDISTSYSSSGGITAFLMRTSSSNSITFFAGSKITSDASIITNSNNLIKEFNYEGYHYKIELISATRTGWGGFVGNSIADFNVTKTPIASTAPSVACKISTQSCTTNTDCCSGLTCQSGTCQTPAASCEDCTALTKLNTCEGSSSKKYDYVCSSNQCVQNTIPLTITDCGTAPADTKGCSWLGRDRKWTQTYSGKGCDIVTGQCFDRGWSEKVYNYCEKVCRDGACTCAPNNDWLPFQADKCCSGKTNFWGFCEA